MDPDVVQRIGADLQRVGAELNRMSGQVDVLVRQIVQSWHGPVSTDFAHQWNSLQRAQALHAAQSVVGLGRAAVNNAEEQRRASGQVGSSMGAALASRGPQGSRIDQQDKLQSRLDGFGDLAGGTSAGLEMIGRLGSFVAFPGTVAAADKLLGKQLRKFANTTDLHDGWKAFKTFSKTSDTAVGKSPFFSKAGPVIGGLSGITTIVSGRGTVSDYTQVAGSLAQLAFKKSPIGGAIVGGGEILDAISNPNLTTGARVGKALEGAVNVAGAFFPPVAVAKAVWDVGKLAIGLFH
jgi:hypothetical protein